MLFNDPKIIFIHIPKTGGASIEHIFTRSPWLLGRDSKMGQHAILQTAYDKYGDLSEYNTFTVVRNTYHRIASLYCMFDSGRGSGFARLGLLDDEKSLDTFVDFPTFYNKIYENFREKGERFLHGEDYFYYNSVNGVIPNHLEIVKFENLEEGFKELWCDRWGLERNIKFPHRNKNKKSGSNSSLRNYLLRDPKFAKVIEEVYEEEIDHFSFSPY